MCFDNIEVEEEVRETPQQIATLLETGEDINKLPNGQLEQLLELFDWQVGSVYDLDQIGGKTA